MTRSNYTCAKMPFNSCHFRNRVTLSRNLGSLEHNDARTTRFTMSFDAAHTVIIGVIGDIMAGMTVASLADTQEAIPSRPPRRGAHPQI